MNALAIIPATLAREGRQTGILSPVEGKPLLGHLLDCLSNVTKLEGVARLHAETLWCECRAVEPTKAARVRRTTFAIVRRYRLGGDERRSYPPIDVRAA